MHARAYIYIYTSQALLSSVRLRPKRLGMPRPRNLVLGYFFLKEQTILFILLVK